jgi:hypothetical protein
MLDVRDIMHYGYYGDMPQIGDLQTADAVVGFAFGVHFNEQGGIGDPGEPNRALARLLVNSEILRDTDTPWFLQEELAMAVEEMDRKAAGKIVNLGSIKAPGETYNTHELIVLNKNQLKEAGTKFIDLAHGYHLPRTAANLHWHGFEVATIDTKVGVFDLGSSQRQIQSLRKWRQREMPAIAYFGLKECVLKLPEQARRRTRAA